MADEQIEYKAGVTPAVLDIDNRDVTTLFSVDCLDQVGDITEVTAFKRSISHRADRIPHLYMHDLHSPAIAKIMSFQSLVRRELPTDVQHEYPDARGGMACVSRYLSVDKGDEVYEGIKAGIPYQASFGYKVLDAEHTTTRDGRKARVIKELRLFEVSTTAPGHAANLATRAWRSKALDALVDEIKAGWRHGTHEDVTVLREVIAKLNQLLGIDESEPGSQLSVAPTSDVDILLSEVQSILSEVSV